MRCFLAAAAMLILGGYSFAAEPLTPGPTAEQIMAKVAANQDRTEAARTRYIYQQHIRMVSRKPGGRVMCEEVTDSRVSPKQKESQQQLLKLDGRYWQKGRYVHFRTLQEHDVSESKDGGSKDEPKDKEVKTE